MYKLLIGILFVAVGMSAGAGQIRDRVETDRRSNEISDYLGSRERERLTSRERGVIDNISDPYTLTDRERDVIRNADIERRDVEYAYETAVREGTQARDTRGGAERGRAGAATSQQRAQGLAQMIMGVIDYGNWRERQEQVENRDDASRDDDRRYQQ